MEDIYNKVLTFLPNSDLKDHRLSPEFFTELIERDFPLTISKDPKERYLGLQEMDIISRGQTYLLIVEFIHPEAIRKKKFITDTAMRRIINKQTYFLNWGDNMFTAYYTEKLASIQVFLDYMHGKFNVDGNSILISEEKYMKLSFSYDKYIVLVCSFGKVTNLFGSDTILTNKQLNFISKHMDEESLIKDLESNPSMDSADGPELVMQRAWKMSNINNFINALLPKL